MFLSAEIIQDVIANRPIAASAGRIFFSSDTGVTYRDDGSSWQAITVDAGQITSGTLDPARLPNPSISTKTAAYAVLTSDYTLLGDATSAAFSFALPASPMSGEIHNFKKIDSAAHDITIDGNGKNIDGGSTLTISVQYASFSVQYDGSQWFVL